MYFPPQTRAGPLSPKNVTARFAKSLPAFGSLLLVPNLDDLTFHLGWSPPHLLVWISHFQFESFTPHRYFSKSVHYPISPVCCSRCLCSKILIVFHISVSLLRCRHLIDQPSRFSEVYITSPLFLPFSRLRKPRFRDPNDVAILGFFFFLTYWVRVVYKATEPLCQGCPSWADRPYGSCIRLC